MDSIDVKLLAAVQKDARQTSDVLGRLVGLSPTACQRRLKRLRETGAIEAEVAVVSPKAVGRPVLAIVSVSLERDRADIFDRFKKAVRAAPEVMQGYSVLGETDFVLLVSARDLDDYEQFTRRFFYENSHIKGFKTTVVIDRLKVGLSLPIEVTE
jgi:Lrp/AsnC family transcriptional regulator, leucine-responsive regulatory protein